MEEPKEIKSVNVGARVAEQEIEGLKNYFVKTHLWEQILNKEIDIVFGCKGSGKSALYGYLSTQEYALMGESVILTLAENPRGAVAFKDLSTNPPKNEFEFKSIWKLYFTVLIYQKLFEFNYDDIDFRVVSEKLQESDLIPRSQSFTSIVKLVRGYIGRINPSIEPNVGISESSGMVDKIGVKISLSEPSTKQSDKGIVSVDHLLYLLNNSLNRSKEHVWITIDRLDAIFQENIDLEASALRSLFQVYIDLQAYSHIRLIIFLRDDIWNRIIENGFRETSHITNIATINWDKSSLQNLIMLRFEQNEKLIKNLGEEEKKDILKRRERLFKYIFPSKTANNTEFTFEWIISRLKDGNNIATPRELIQLVNSAIKHEINLLLEGNKTTESLIRLESLNYGLLDASKTKLDTLVAEYPKLKNFIYRLKKNKVRLDVNELSNIWDCSKKEAKVIINNLCKIGFFKNENSDENDPQLLIPIIYRPALNIHFN